MRHVVEDSSVSSMLVKIPFARVNLRPQPAHLQPDYSMLWMMMNNFPINLFFSMVFLQDDEALAGLQCDEFV
jgi:hypothetical protein